MNENNKVKTDKFQGVGLKREIGLCSAVNYALCVIIGSGIFITPGKVLLECGSVGMMVVVWTVCGAIAFLTCLPFGELSSLVPLSGSIYIYLHTTFKNSHPFFGGLPAFLYLWIEFAITRPASTAVKTMLFADYGYVVLHPFLSKTLLANDCLVKCTLGAGAVVVIAIINCVSVKLHFKFQNVLTFIKMAAIMFTMSCGIYLFVSGRSYKYHVGFEGTNHSVKGLTQALLFGLYAYDGGWAAANITEELKNPERNILLSILISLIITTTTYLLLNLTFLTALSQSEMANSTTIMSDFAEKLFGPSGGAIAAAIICLCLFTSIMCDIFGNSRLGYVAAREGHMVKILCYIQKTQQTPAPAVIFQVFLILVYFFSGEDVTVLIDMCSFLAWIAYGVAMMSLFILRQKFPSAHRPFRVPSFIPVMVMAISCYIVVETLIVTPLSLLAAFTVCVISITVAYCIFIYKAFRFKTVDKLQEKLQKLLMLIPPQEEHSPK